MPIRDNTIGQRDLLSGLLGRAGTLLDVDARHLEQAAILLEEACEAALARRAVERHATEPIVLSAAQQRAKESGHSIRDTRDVMIVKSSAREGGGWEIGLHVPSDTIRPSAFALDPDNAAALARLLRRAASNIEWMTPRLHDLDLSRPDSPELPPPP